MESVGKPQCHLKLQGDASYICVSHGVFWCMWTMCSVGVVGSGEVAARVCMMLWKRCLDC